jgi:hypothetical protein
MRAITTCLGVRPPLLVIAQLGKRAIRSDALYPALSGEWEVPVTSNAKITPVNEGVGGGSGGLPSGITFGRVPRYPQR